jgi:hypothetical protein
MTKSLGDEMAIPLRTNQVKPKQFTAQSNNKVKDPRLWVGIAFVLVAMILGQLAMSNASARVFAVVLTTDIARGSLITEADVSAAQVAVPSTQNLLEMPSDAVGKVAVTDLFAGDLVSVQAVSSSFASDSRVVSIPISAGHLPSIAHGGKVDIWMTPSVDGVALPGPSALIIAGAVVDTVPDYIDVGMDTSVTVMVSTDQVQTLVQAMRDGVIDLVAIPNSGDTL